MKTVNEILALLDALANDADKMSIPLWRKVHEQLELDLKRAHKANAFDYDAAIDATRQDDEADLMSTLEDGYDVSQNGDYDRQWAISLHVWRVALVWPVVIMFASAAVVAL